MATKRKKAIDKAMDEAKEYLDKECIFCGSTQYVEGMHVVSRKFKEAIGIGYEMADYPENIYPGCVKHHDYLDNLGDGRKRSPEKRIELIRMLVAVNASSVKRKLAKLEKELDFRFGDRWRDPVRDTHSQIEAHQMKKRSMGL